MLPNQFVSRVDQMGRRIVLLSVLLLMSAIGCAGVQGSPPPAAPQTQGYVVGAPDELSILILPDPVIDRSVVVRPDGMISVDLVGDIQAAGRSPLEIASDIQEKIARFKRDAVVNVTVVSSPSPFVTIYGEVSRQASSRSPQSRAFPKRLAASAVRVPSPTWMASDSFGAQAEKRWYSTSTWRRFRRATLGRIMSCARAT